MATIANTIRTAVGSNVPRRYAHLMDQAAVALQGREDRIINELCTVAARSGLSRRQVLNALRQARDAADRPVAAPAAPRGLDRRAVRQVADTLRQDINGAFDRALSRLS